MSRAIGIAGWSVLVLLGVLYIAALAGLRLNLSPSVPCGVYWLASDPAPRVGDYIALCPPHTPLFEEAREHGYIHRGRCSAGYGELIKVLAASEGAAVVATHEGVVVDGNLWPHSTPRRQDALGRPVPHRPLPWREVLAATSILVMSEGQPSGFDARYFGPLERTAIVAVALPLFVW